MDYDLLFTIIPKTSWRTASNEGEFAPESLESQGYIRCIPDKELENYANSQFNGEDELLLIVIDPLRIQVPIKHETVKDIQYPLICGSLKLDAIIEKIDLTRDKKNKFRISIKHFD
ncbi:MAG: DUF952 domain-containing protein [Balneolaceae bacterium]